MRRIIFAACIADATIWAFVVYETLALPSDPATGAFDRAAAILVTVLLALTALPAALLAARAPRAALALALGFPAMFVLLFLAAVFAFA